MFTLGDQSGGHEEETDPSDSIFAKVLSVGVDDRKDDVDDRKNEQTIIEIEDSFEVEAGLAPFFDWFADHPLAALGSDRLGPV